MWPRWLSNAWNGKDSLARAFWFWGVGVSVAYSLIGVIIDVEHPMVLTIYLTVGLVLGMLQTVIMWRSSSNSAHRLLGRLVRTTVIFGLLMMVLMLYMLLTHPGLLLSPGVRWSEP